MSVCAPVSGGCVCVRVPPPGAGLSWATEVGGGQGGSGRLSSSVRPATAWQGGALGLVKHWFQ